MNKSMNKNDKVLNMDVKFNLKDFMKNKKINPIMINTIKVPVVFIQGKSMNPVIIPPATLPVTLKKYKLPTVDPILFSFLCAKELIKGKDAPISNVGMNKKNIDQIKTSRFCQITIPIVENIELVSCKTSKLKSGWGFMLNDASVSFPKEVNLVP